MDVLRYDQDNTDAFIQGIRLELSKRVYAAAEYLRSELARKLSTAYPPASVPGEYPHARTFHGRNSATVYPADFHAIALKLFTQVGYLQNAFYMGILEEKRHRLGLFHLYQQIKPELMSILGGRGYTTAA